MRWAYHPIGMLSRRSWGPGAAVVDALEVGVPAVQHLVGTNLTAPMQELARADLLKPGDEYMHCLGIDDAGWRLIKDTDGRVSICARRST